MATNKGEGSSSDRENRLLQAVNRSAERFEEGLDMLMAQKRNDERLEKAIAGLIETDRENYLHHYISELKKRQDLKDEIKVKIEEMVQRIQTKGNKYREEAIAQRDAREEEMRWVESAVEDMISQLSKAANQVTEDEDEKNP